MQTAYATVQPSDFPISGAKTCYFMRCGELRVCAPLEYLLYVRLRGGCAVQRAGVKQRRFVFIETIGIFEFVVACDHSRFV